MCGFTTDHHYILISNGETFIGHSLAWYIADQLERKQGHIKSKNWRVRLLCSISKGLEDLHKMGVDVQEVDYSNLSLVTKQMENVKLVVLWPDETKYSVSNGKNIIDAASAGKVKSIQMISMYDNEKNLKKDGLLYQHEVLEEHLRESYAYGRWCIHRISFIHQFFHFWSPMVQDFRFGLPLAIDTVFPSIHILDLCDAIATLLFSPKNQSQDTMLNEGPDIPDRAVKRIHHLTGTNHCTGNAIVKVINESIQDDKKAIKYIKLDSKEMYSYFEKIALRRCSSENHKKRAMFCPEKTSFGLGDYVQSSISWVTGAVDTILTDRTESCGPDAPGFIPDPSLHLKPPMMNMLVEFFKAIETAPRDSSTKDLEELIGHRPKEIESFFNDNKNSFQPEESGDEN